MRFLKNHMNVNPVDASNNVIITHLIKIIFNFSFK